ncbi:hypothetical protein OC835_001579 [Tilletia horrida]|nr:hypothetical protein OC835_001579 [Tilletia horrida]
MESLVHPRLDDQFVGRLADRARLELPADGVPPALHLISWHVPGLSDTQYVRFLRRSDPESTQSDAQLCRLVPVSDHMAGVWNRHSGILREENVLFEYTQQPPRPPPFGGFSMPRLASLSSQARPDAGSDAVPLTDGVDPHSVEGRSDRIILLCHRVMINDF